MGASLVGLGLEGWGWLAFVAYYSLVTPWLEELFWRGWYPTVVGQGIMADLLFAGYHLLVVALFIGWPWVVLCFAVLTATAFVWRLVARREGEGARGAGGGPYGCRREHHRRHRHARPRRSLRRRTCSVFRRCSSGASQARTSRYLRGWSPWSWSWRAPEEPAPIRSSPRAS